VCRIDSQLSDAGRSYLRSILGALAECLSRKRVLTVIFCRSPKFLVDICIGGG